MCLYEPKKLNQTEDIICYKVLFKGGWCDNQPFNEDVLFSPFYFSPYRIGNTKYTRCQDNVVNGHCKKEKTSKFLYDGFCVLRKNEEFKAESYASQKIKPIAIIDCFELKYNTV